MDAPSVFLDPADARPRSGGTVVSRELAERARARLLIVSLLMGGIGLTAMLVFFITGPGQDFAGVDPRHLKMDRSLLWTTITISFAVAVVMWKRVVKGLWVLVVGMLYQVCVASFAALNMTLGMMTVYGHVPPLTWTEVVIVFFPLLIPAPPRYTVVVALLSAATRPIAVLVVHHGFSVPMPPEWQLMSTVPTAFACVLAVVG